MIVWLAKAMSISQVKSTVKTAELFELVLVWELPLTCAILCFKENQVPTKIRVLPSGTLSQTLDLENFTMASHIVKELVDG